MKLCVFAHFNVGEPNPYTVHSVFSRHKHAPQKIRPARRPPITICALSETYCVLSHIQLRVSFLVLIPWLATVIADDCQVMNELSPCSVLEPILLFLLVGSCLLYRRPPDKFFALPSDIIIAVAPKGANIRRFLRIIVFSILTFLLTSQLPDISFQGLFKVSKARHSSCEHEHCAFMAMLEKESSPRLIGDWDSDSIPIVVDSASSASLTPFKSDLRNIRPYKSLVTGFGASNITHVGEVSWCVKDINGNNVYLEDDTCYYAPNAPYRLLCPHNWKKCRNKKRYEAGETEGDQATFMLSPDDLDDDYVLSWNHGKTLVTCKIDPSNNLPTVYTTGEYREFKAFVSAFQAFPNVIEDDDDDEMGEAMSIAADSDDDTVQDHDAESFATPSKAKRVDFSVGPNQKEPTVSIDDPITHRDEELFLSWHLKLGHAPYQYIRWAAELGILPPKLKKIRNVVCPACMYGKQKRRPWRTKGSAEQQGKIKKATRPGECISVDQLISGVPGLVGQTTGKLTKSRYMVATIFVDHYSDLDYVHVQASTSAEDTIEAKQAFEKFALDRGVKIEQYHADNGIFASRGFREEVHRCGQKLTFCGVGAHHQNGVAERRIQDLTDSARAMLAHASHRNPAVTAHLWPYALRHASYTRRILPRNGHSKSPEEFFTGAPVRPTTKYLHPFGCPVYVLQAALQSGGTQPKWNDRSRVGVYLGHSAQHAPSVALILNPTTGYVSPQFHCIYDNKFDTPSRDKNFSQLWADKAGLSEEPEEEPSFDFSPSDYTGRAIPMHLQVPFEPPVPAAEEPTQDDDFPIPDDEGDGDDAANEDQDLALDEFNDEQPNQEPPNPMQEQEGAIQSPFFADEPIRTTRSGRVIQRTRRLTESELLPRLRSLVSIAHHVTNVLSRLDDNSLNELTKFVAFPASLADSDTMYLKEAMRQPDKDKFLEAMVKEIDDHTRRGHWRVTTKAEMRSKG